MRNGGFILITTLLSTILVGSLLALLMFQIIGEWKGSNATEGQLHSYLMAENGIVSAMNTLRYHPIDDLLKGPDQEFSSSLDEGWRDPISMHDARRFDPGSWLPVRDDGILFDSNNRPFYSSSGGQFIARFSNNPEENADLDDDRIVIARSMGIVPVKQSYAWFPEIRNHACLVEARLRKEQIFNLPSPLVLFGNGGDFSFEGRDFRIQAKDAYSITLVSESSMQLEECIRKSINPDQTSCINGTGSGLSLLDNTNYFQTHSDQSRIFTSDFWTHFEENLPEFSDKRCSLDYSVHQLEADSIIEEDCNGVIVTRGNTFVQGDALIQGVLIHLGGGVLTLSDSSRVIEGVWLSNVVPENGSIRIQPLSFSISGKSQISYDREKILEALTCFPATLLTWRLIFP